jgi:hypothetical protein
MNETMGAVSKLDLGWLLLKNEKKGKCYEGTLLS